jgi:hypothetical protein
MMRGQEGFPMPVSRLLRYALLADAAATAATALMLIAFGSDLAAGLGIPAVLQRNLGLAFLPYAAAVGYLGARRQIAPMAVWTVIGCNVGWAVLSIAVLFTPWLQPTALGAGFVVAQAVIVAALAEFQWFGMRRSVGLPSTVYGLQ